MKYFISAIVDSQSVPQVRDVFLQATRDAGFDHAVYAGRFSLSLPPSILRGIPVTFNDLPADLLAQSKNLYGVGRDAWVECVLQND